MRKKNNAIIKIGDEAQGIIWDSLKKTGKVKITGLGVFRVSHIPKSEMYIPGAGEKRIVPPHNRLSFTPTKQLRNYIK